jgi:hypothetical protein
METTLVDALGGRDANEADMIDQAIVVPVPEDDDAVYVVRHIKSVYCSRYFRRPRIRWVIVVRPTA